MTHNAYIVYQYIPVLFSILIWFSICIKLSVFRNNSISLGMGMDDAKNSIFLANGFHLIRFSFRSWKLINNTFQTCLDEELRRQTEEHQRMLDWNS